MLRYIALPVRVKICLVRFGPRYIFGAENRFADRHAFVE
jgi:hypothetical protein